MRNYSKEERKKKEKKEEENQKKRGNETVGAIKKVERTGINRVYCREVDRKLITARQPCNY